MAVMCAAVAMTACDGADAHTGEGEGGVGFDLVWADIDDLGTPVSDVHLWIYKSDGTLVSESGYASAADLARKYISVPPEASDYVAVIGVNLISPFSAEEVFTYESMEFRLGDTSASLAHAFYATQPFTYKGSGYLIVTVTLRRVMSELSVIMEGVPDGATLKVTVSDAATAVSPAVKDGDGRYGVAKSTATTVSLPTATAAHGTITTETVRLMPTTKNNALSHLHFTLTLADGTVQEFDAEAPKMYPSGKYVVTMKYGDMRAFMYLTAVSINDWTEGWTIGGEILNPD